MGRIATRTVTVGGRAYQTTYGYALGGYGAASTTPLIQSVTQDGKTTSYAYDDVGNIQSVDTPFNPVEVEDQAGKLYMKDETGLEQILYASRGRGRQRQP